jgi:hypothetical protein
MRALARDPRDRYASAADMRAALQSVQEQLWRDMPISGGRPNQHDTSAAPPASPYPFAPGAAAGASDASKNEPRSAMEPAPPPAVPGSVQRRANGGTRGAEDQSGDHGNRHGRAAGNEDSNAPARDDDKRRIPQPFLLIALVAMLALIALVSGLNLAVNIVNRGDNQTTPTPALSYESLSATSTALAQTATRPPPPPPPPPPLIVTPMTGSYPCNGSVDTTLTVFNAGPSVLTWSAAPVGPNSTGVKLDASDGTLTVGASTPVHVTGTPTGSPFDVRFTSNGGSPTVRFICD